MTRVALLDARDGARRVLPAVHARGAEEHHGVLDVLFLEPAQRFEVFGENPDGARFLGLQKVLGHVGERLFVAHAKNCII
jgi:hypothetical protein